MCAGIWSIAISGKASQCLFQVRNTISVCDWHWYGNGNCLAPEQIMPKYFIFLTVNSAIAELIVKKCVIYALCDSIEYS